MLSYLFMIHSYISFRRPYNRDSKMKRSPKEKKSVNDISFLASQQIFQHLPKEDLTCHQTCTNGFMNNISIINSTIMWKPLVKHSWIYQSFRMTAINLSNLKLDLWGLIIGCQQKRLRMRYHFHPFILKIFYHSFRHILYVIHEELIGFDNQRICYIYFIINS